MSDVATLYTNPDALASRLIEHLVEQGYIGQKANALWTKSECAEYLRCSTIHLDMLIRERGFPVIDLSKPGSNSRDLRFSPEAVKLWEIGQK